MGEVIGFGPSAREGMEQAPNPAEIASALVPALTNAAPSEGPAAALIHATALGHALSSLRDELVDSENEVALRCALEALDRYSELVRALTALA
jgi:hypothetical protein